MKIFLREITIKTLKKAGFLHEAYLEDEILAEDGEYRDLVRMKVLL